MKIIFMGTPDFALPCLQALVHSRHEIVGVVTQCDKPVGRGGVITAPPIKVFAEKYNLKVFQFEKISKDGVSILSTLNADIMVTCAYGQILSQQIIDIAPFGIINVHASLLPKYRGAAPIQWCIINGDTETGVTIMQTEAGLDTGDIIHVIKTQIGTSETAGELFDRLAGVGSVALLEALDLIESGKCVKTAQNTEFATSVKMLKKENGLIDWSLSAPQIYNLVRGLNPWPIAFTMVNGEVMKVYSCEAVEIKNRRLYACGEVIESSVSGGLVIAARSGTAVKLGIIQLPNKKRMPATEFLKGHNIEVGTVLGGINE